MMANDEIFTALKNSIERGESLKKAMEILANSGYNQKEIEEASRFFSNSEIVLDDKANHIENNPKNVSLDMQKNEPVISKQLPKEQTIDQIKQKVSGPIPSPSIKPITPQLNKIHPKKKSYFKEILLLVVLLVLVAVLIVTVLFKDSLLKFFSGMG